MAACTAASCCVESLTSGRQARSSNAVFCILDIHTSTSGKAPKVRQIACCFGFYTPSPWPLDPTTCAIKGTQGTVNHGITLIGIRITFTERTL